MNRGTIRSFTDLIAWQEAHKLVLLVYRVTEKFPKSETFGLTNQLRRAAVSVTSNIAEGFNRNTSKEKANFYAISHGSVAEIQSQLLIARDVGFLEKESFLKIAEQAISAHKLLTGLIRSTKKE